MKAIISATTIETQMPSIPKISGNNIIAAAWNTNVLKKEIKAEISPLLRAVKKDEPKIAIPAKINEKANI